MGKNKETVVLTISTLIIGALVGLGSLVLSVFYDVIQRLFLHYNETTWAPVAWVSGPQTRLVSLVVGGILVAMIWWLMRTKMKPTVSINQGMNGTVMPVRTTAVHVLTQIFFVGVGGSVGKELAPRELGAMLSQTLQRLIKRVSQVQLSAADRKLLVAAAAGAGFAGVYIAPITGTMFSLELLLKRVDQRAILVSLTMSIEAMLVGAIAKGFTPYYGVGHGKFSLISSVVVLVIGPVCGLFGSLFRQLFKRASAHQTRDRNILWQLPLVALLTGLIAVYFPEIMGNGRPLAQTALTTSSSTVILKVLLVGAVLKAVVTVLSLRAGASGGTLTPSIAVGTVIGVTFGLVVHAVVPGVPMWEMGLLGAASFLAASQQAPLMALFMIFEVCHLNYSALLPLGLGVCLAVATSKLILNQPAR